MVKKYDDCVVRIDGCHVWCGTAYDCANFVKWILFHPFNGSNEVPMVRIQSIVLDLARIESIVIKSYDDDNKSENIFIYNGFLTDSNIDTLNELSRSC